MNNYSKVISTFILMAVSCTSLYSQMNNLVNNSSFEISHPNAPSGAPDGLAQVHVIKSGGDDFYLSEWRSRTRIASDNTSHFLHSPDWFKTPGNFSHIYGGPVNDGIGYIGMGNYELIQQEFHKYNRMVEGETYLLSMYVQLSNAGPNSIVDPTSYNFSDSELRIYLAKNSLEYKREKKYEDKCTKKYIQLENGAAQNIKILHTFQLSISDFPAGSGWHKIQAVVTGPSNAQNYEWFGMELVRKNYNPDNTVVVDCDKNGYLLIDNVVLAKGCPETCSRTTGFYNPQFSGLHTFNTPWFVTGLDNIGSATIKIFTLLGQFPIRTITVNSPNGITNPIYWNGKTQSGAEAAAGVYIAECTLVNDCGTAVFSNTFSKANGANNGTIPPPTFPPYNTSGTTTPRPCCSSIHDHFLDNVTLSGPGKLEYVIQHDLHVATLGNVNLTSTADVLFQAGNQVNIGGNFSTAPGANYDIVIVPCPPLKTLDGSVTTFVTEAEDYPKNEDENTNRDMSNDIQVTPNPSSGYFYIRLNSVIFEEENATLTIYDAMGKVVYEKRSLNLGLDWFEQIDISSHSKGIYFIKVEGGDNRYTKKIVIE